MAMEKGHFDWVPEGCEVLADGEYDAIVLGTGLKECIISGLLAVKGKKILHIDRNDYYGAECASLNLTNLYKKFRGTDAPDNLGPNRDYNIDLIPKFIMSGGRLVKILTLTKVTRYLEFKNVAGSYVAKSEKIHKVPVTVDEAIRTSLMGMFEKRKFRNMLQFIDGYEKDDPKTSNGLNLADMTMSSFYSHFGVDQNTQSFTGHAIALKTSDAYLNEPALRTVEEIKLYAKSLKMYGKSPYVYPIYGLGGLPEGFSRLSAIHGGTFILNRPVSDILMDDDGKAWGVRCNNSVAKADMVIGDPSYFKESQVKRIGKVARSIFILNHPLDVISDSESCQIIIPAAQAQRKNDIYVCVVSFAHCVSAQGMYIAIVSTDVETANPIQELDHGVRLLGSYLDRFDAVSDKLVPVDDGVNNRMFISESYDATSHFETTTEDVLSLYKRITGEELNMEISTDTEETA